MKIKVLKIKIVKVKYNFKLRSIEVNNLHKRAYKDTKNMNQIDDIR